MADDDISVQITADASDFTSALEDAANTATESMDKMGESAAAARLMTPNTCVLNCLSFLGTLNQHHPANSGSPSQCD